MPMDLVIEVENAPGALAKVAKAISDAGVNIAAAKHALAISQLAVTREREVAVVEVDDRPGVLADLAGKVAAAGVNLNLVYVATMNRVVFGSEDLAGLRKALAS
jgi:hypothetical protein